MKKTLLLLGLSACTLGASAQTATLGFCNSEQSTEASVRMDERGWLDCALRIPANQLSGYAGSTVTAVRAALVQRINTDSLRVWLRHSPDGPNLAEQLILRSGTTPTVQQGWNEVPFDTPYTLEGGSEDLYIGFSIYQKTGVNIISQVSPRVRESSFCRLKGGEWTDISSYGVVSVEALVSGDKLPQHDLGLLSAQVSPAPTTSATAMQATATLFNAGTEAVSSIQFDVERNGSTAAQTELNLSLQPGQTQTISFPFDPQSEVDESDSWLLKLTGLNGGADEVADNNTAEAVYAYQRNVLIEEFTTERCPNCPSVANALHEFLSQASYADRVYAIAHHSGYYEDSYTQPADRDYLQFYPEYPGNYAPGMMMNRRAAYPHYNSSSYLNTIFIPGSASTIAYYADIELQREANAVLGLTLAYNADSTQVTASVGVKCNAMYDTPNPRLNVFLLENDIFSSSQSGAGKSFYQQHVTRAYNSTWGEPVVWDDNTFQYSCTFDLQDNWVKKNMEVVAFVYNYNANDFQKCEVDNCVRFKLADILEQTGLPTVCGPKAVTEKARYDLSGRRLSQPDSRGIQLIQLSDGTVKKVIR